MKHLFLAAALTCVLALRARAAVVSFQFAGVIDYLNNPSNQIPAGISNGTPFTGTMMFDTAGAQAGFENTPNTNHATYYFTNDATFSFTAKVGGHDFTTITPAPRTSDFNIVVEDGYFGQDEFSTDDSIDHLLIDGEPFPAGSRGGFNFYLTDGVGTATISEALPENPPALSAFSNKRQFGVVLTTANNESVYFFFGTITNITPTSHPLLTIRRKSDTEVELAWPFAAKGFIVEYSTSLPPADWKPLGAPITDTETEHLSADDTKSTEVKFYRLIKN
jgi:hypothetical protein